MKASDLKKGAVVAIDGKNYIVREVVVKSPSSRSGNTLYKVQFRNIVTKQKYEQTYKGDDVLEDVEFSRRPVQLLFRDADSATFMDNDNYEQFTIDNDAIESEALYLSEGLEGILALISENTLLGIELPATVELEIIECSPAIKGASAAARTKPATLSTGLVVQVPEYISVGERIKVNTGSSDFVSRA